MVRLPKYWRIRKLLGKNSVRPSHPVVVCFSHRQYAHVGHDQLALDHNWEGRGSPPAEGFLHATGVNVHRFKIDMDRGFVITTHTNGGLVVSPLDPQRVEPIFQISNVSLICTSFSRTGLISPFLG